MKKKILISEKEFNEIIVPEDKHHYYLPSEVIPRDENEDAFKETLIGMEYDIETNNDKIDFVNGSKKKVLTKKKKRNR